MSIDAQVVVVGAGMGGLSAAIHLAVQGYKVHIFERQPQVGGKLNQIQMDGFHFDTGPSLITMPAVFRGIFQSAGRRLEDYLDLQPLELTCRYFYRDGAILNAWRDHERLAAEYARFNPADGAAFWRFLEHVRIIYEASAGPFLFSSPGSPLQLLRTFARQAQMSDGTPDSASGKQHLREIFSALLAPNMEQHVSHYFQDEHLRQLYARYATYNGSSPYQVSGIYSIIPYVELADGGWYPMGGIYAVAQALEKLARELGVEITTSCDVRRILVEYGEARGVVLADGRVVRSELVVANSDVVTTHLQLLSASATKPRYVRHLEHLEPSCSGFVLLLGVKKRYPELAHHNIFFSDNYPAEFEDLFERKIPQRNPTIYICATSRTDPSQAPADHENLFVLINAPYLTASSNWQRDAVPYREHILDLLATYTQIDLSDLREHIVSSAILTPEDFWQRYGSNAGSIYGLSSNSRLAPFVRPGNRSTQVRNLYFVGGSTHPGGGVPLVLLSGKIVSALIVEDAG